jgi:hypothetical protein
MLVVYAGGVVVVCLLSIACGLISPEGAIGCLCVMSMTIDSII